MLARLPLVLAGALQVLLLAAPRIEVPVPMLEQTYEELERLSKVEVRLRELDAR